MVSSEPYERINTQLTTITQTNLAKRDTKEIALNQIRFLLFAQVTRILPLPSEPNLEKEEIAKRKKTKMEYDAFIKVSLNNRLAYQKLIDDKVESNISQYKEKCMI
jgi:hypothetical protein